MTKELDLHGITHMDAPDIVENFLLLNEPPMRIITGHSGTMRGIVIKILDKHNFKYAIPVFNQGEIIIL